MYWKTYYSIHWIKVLSLKKYYNKILEEDKIMIIHDLHVNDSDSSDSSNILQARIVNIKKGDTC